MPLISVGSFSDFSLSADIGPVTKGSRKIKQFHTLSATRELARELQTVPLVFDVTKDNRGLGLKAIKLLEGFEGFLQNLLNKNNEIFFLAWCWDLSGQPVIQYPVDVLKPESCVFNVRVGKLRQFIGEGIKLFPARPITAGMEVRLMVWESDQKSQDFGQTLKSVVAGIRESKLNNLLNAISLIGGVPLVTVKLIEEAALELADIIGTCLKANSNDYVDLFAGYYPASGSWEKGDDISTGPACEITLSKFN